MFHYSKQLRVIGWDHHGPDRIIVKATANALRDVGHESLILWDRMLDNTTRMLFSAATHKDAKDVSRTMSTFANASYRDVVENAEAISRIWRRYSRDAVARIAATPSSPHPLAAAGR
jgi:hypothetical protein